MSTYATDYAAYQAYVANNPPECPSDLAISIQLFGLSQGGSLGGGASTSIGTPQTPVHSQVGNSSSPIIGANANRSGFLISNHSEIGKLKLNVTTPASATRGILTIAPEQTVDFQNILAALAITGIAIGDTTIDYTIVEFIVS